MEGAEVTMVDTGQGALDRLHQQGSQAFDIVLMDIQMPTMDGHEATRRIRHMDPSLPVIGQTAHAMPEERIRCMDVGMVDMVVKPIVLQQLIDVVQKHARPRSGAAA